jgi:hypothetical protein
MAGLDPAIHASPALFASIRHSINLLVASVGVHVDGRVTPGSQSGGGQDEKPKDRRRKEINNSYRYKSRKQGPAIHSLGSPRPFSRQVARRGAAPRYFPPQRCG